LCMHLQHQQEQRLVLLYPSSCQIGAWKTVCSSRESSVSSSSTKIAGLSCSSRTLNQIARTRLLRSRWTGGWLRAVTLMGNSSLSHQRSLCVV
jgi:hypothetical protein